MLINRRYSQLALKIWGLAGGVVAMIFVAVILVASVHNSGVNSANHQIEARHHFWQVVAGQTTPSAPTVDNKLALDLRVALHSRNPSQAINNFTGNSNEYGGITDQIGVDPFSGQSCHECGPLSSYMKDRLGEIRNGNVAEVVATDKPTGHKYSTSWVWILALVWLISLPLMLYFPTLTRRHKLKSVEEVFPEDGRMIDKLDKAMRELPPGDPQYNEFRDLRDKLDAALNRQLVSTKDEVAKTRRKELAEQARVSIAAYEEGNKYLNA